jgi:hypothetical protein
MNTTPYELINHEPKKYMLESERKQQKYQFLRNSIELHHAYFVKGQTIINHLWVTECYKSQYKMVQKDMLNQGVFNIQTRKKTK